MGVPLHMVRCWAFVGVMSQASRLAYSDLAVLLYMVYVLIDNQCCSSRTGGENPGLNVVPPSSLMGHARLLLGGRLFQTQ